MANYTIIGGDGKQYGPITGDDLRKWISERRLNAQSLAKADSDAEFRALSTFPELADAFAPQAAEPSAPPVFDSTMLAEGDYELDIGDCISKGWELVKKNFWPVVGVTALVMLAMGAVNQIFGLFSRSAINEMVVQHQFTPGAIAIVIAVTIISAPVYTVFTAGLFKYFLKLIRGESAGVGDAFSGFGPSIGQLIVFSVMQMILLLIGYALCIIPGIYLSVTWYFAIPLIIDRRMNFWEAMELSRKMVNKHWIIIFAFLIVYGLLALAGMIACCIGIFVTMPIGFAALMYAYETIFSKSQTR
jgi:uncharacterized membrane protein